MQKNSLWQMIADFVRHDTIRKLVAVFLTLLLYVAIGQRTSERREKFFHEIPVHLELPANLALSNNEVPKVVISLIGNAESLNDIAPGALRVRAAVSRENFIPGEPYRLRLQPEDVSGFDYHVRVGSISPRDLELNLEPVISKRVMVRPRYDSQDKMLQDYEIAEVRFVPASVVLRGPARLLDSVQDIFTYPIPLDDQVTDSFEYRCSLRIPHGLTGDRSEVDAHVEVVKALTHHTFRVGPLRIIQSAERTRKFKVTDPEPNVVTVMVGGPRGTLARMHSRELSASISLDNINKPGTYDLPISVNFPSQISGLQIKSFQPETARVTVVQE